VYALCSPDGRHEVGQILDKDSRNRLVFIIMERAAVQPTRHWAIADYFQRTFEDITYSPSRFELLRPRRICDIYDLFAPFI